MYDGGMKIAICDDQKLYRDEIVSLCKECLGEAEAFYKCFASGEELLSANEVYDFLFLDIEMGGLDGIQIKEMLESRGVFTKIIFLTSHDERMIEAFGANVIGFLKKPVNLESLAPIIKKIKMFMERRVIEWEESGQEYAIVVEDIRYIEAQDKYTYVVCKNEKHLVRRTLQNWEEVLPDTDFCRVNRSYLINMELFDRTQNEIILEIGKTVKLSRKNKSLIEEQYKKYLRKRMSEL